MQKINIKKYTKEQMLKMLEEAVEKQEAAAHFKDGAKLAEENEKLRGEIGALTEKLEAKVADIRIINRAKLLLVQHLQMTETEAHKYIEKQAMDTSMRRRTIAENIIRTYED